MKKNGDINNNPIMLIFLSLIFLATGIVCLVMLTTDFNGILLLIGCLFTPVGLVLLVNGFYRAVKLSQYKKLLNDPNAYETQAKFITSKVSSYKSQTVSTSGATLPTSVSIYKKIIYSYTDENGDEQTVKSLLSYTINQIEYLQGKEVFKVKCKGKLSAITEQLPDPKKDFSIKDVK